MSCPFRNQTKRVYNSSGYRPISLLSDVSKLLEKLIQSRISEHLAEHAPISDAQWGFQKGKSTVTALLSTTHDLLMHMHRSEERYPTAYSLICRKHLTLSLTDG